MAFPFTPRPISGYDFGTPVPARGWTGTGSDFGWPIHLGTDFGTIVGEPIIAPEAGSVQFQTGLLGYGNRIVEKLASGWTIIFGHVQSGINGVVQKGQQIGIAGANVGSSQGSVTLVELINPMGQHVNPDTYIKALASSAPTSSTPGGIADITFPGGSIHVANPAQSIADWVTNAFQVPDIASLFWRAALIIIGLIFFVKGLENSGLPGSENIKLQLPKSEGFARGEHDDSAKAGETESSTGAASTETAAEGAAVAA